MDDFVHPSHHVTQIKRPSVSLAGTHHTVFHVNHDLVNLVNIFNFLRDRSSSSLIMGGMRKPLETLFKSLREELK